MAPGGSVLLMDWMVVTADYAKTTDEIMRRHRNAKKQREYQERWTGAGTPS